MIGDYQISFIDSGPVHLPAGKVICVGLNYLAHAEEMGSKVVDEPVLFMKGTTALTCFDQPLSIPGGMGECHYETEIAVLIGERCTRCNTEQARAAISGIGIALDLTLRDLQHQLKASGLPWAKAKAFDGSCPLSPFVPMSAVEDLNNLDFRLKLNGSTVQEVNTSRMLRGVVDLISYISRYFTLLPGDIVLTGTPAGVGPLQQGDRIDAEIVGLLSVSTEVADCDRQIG